VINNIIQEAINKILCLPLYLTFIEPKRCWLGAVGVFDENIFRALSARKA
jgi:hypothetical protein